MVFPPVASRCPLSQTGRRKCSALSCPGCPAADCRRSGDAWVALELPVHLARSALPGGHWYELKRAFLQLLSGPVSGVGLRELPIRLPAGLATSWAGYSCCLRFIGYPMTTAQGSGRGALRAGSFARFSVSLRSAVEAVPRVGRRSGLSDRRSPAEAMRSVDVLRRVVKERCLSGPCLRAGWRWVKSTCGHIYRQDLR